MMTEWKSFLELSHHDIYILIKNYLEGMIPVYAEVERSLKNVASTKFDYKNLLRPNNKVAVIF